MCNNCIIQLLPDRGTTCLETGSYFLNFKGCGSCGKKGMIKNINHKKEENEIKETILFTHICVECNHIICEHSWEFEVVDKFQEYTMNCLLCGSGESQHAIDPTDSLEMLRYQQ
jgi:hypothetical protein